MLRVWWEGLLPHARVNARTAALNGPRLPPGLLYSLVAAGVITAAEDYITRPAYPVNEFPMPADVRVFLLTAPDPPPPDPVIPSAPPAVVELVAQLAGTDRADSPAAAGRTGDRHDWRTGR